MASTAYPFPIVSQEAAHGNDADCSLAPLFGRGLQDASEEEPHLKQYLHYLPLGEIGVPKYMPKLARGMKESNVIYPVGNRTFVHVFNDPADSRNWYLPVEPTLVSDLDEILKELDAVLLDYVEDFKEVETDEERRTALIELIEKICLIERKPPVGKRRKGSRLRVTVSELAALKYLVIRDKVGLGRLEPLIRDPYVEDISCSGAGPLFLEHKIFKACKSSITFDRIDELDDFVLRMSERIKKPVTFRRPIVDASLPDGSRINIVFGSDVSKRGSNFTIRKFADVPMSVVELVNSGSLSYQVAAYLWMIIGDGMNLFVSGETASGKTTLLNAITTFIPTAGKIVTLEDTSELQVPHANWIRELTREGGASTDGVGVGMFDLLKAALRQRPNAILVGEIRGEEGAIAFQAMQTGHAVMSTFHASTVERLIQRVTGHPISVPKAYVDNLNVVVIQSAVRLGSGQIVRRVVSVNEIVGYDPSSDSFSFIEVFRWDPIADVFEFVGDKNSYLLESRVAPKLGIPAHRVREVYDELNRRVNILKQLSTSGVTNFYELYKVLSKAERDGLI